MLGNLYYEPSTVPSTVPSIMRVPHDFTECGGIYFETFSLCFSFVHFVFNSINLIPLILTFLQNFSSGPRVDTVCLN